LPDPFIYIATRFYFPAIGRVAARNQFRAPPISPLTSPTKKEHLFEKATLQPQHVVNIDAATRPLVASLVTPQLDTPIVNSH
jgi:hypothetical protein